MKVAKVWVTPQAENVIANCARVSNPNNQNNAETAPRLLKYLVKHKHWSPFEMASMCVEIECTRDIARQILRHRSFSFQEFSQRYAEAQDFELSDLRMQDTKNRQNSIATDDKELKEKWIELQKGTITTLNNIYQEALKNGVAKEVARKFLPEGFTMSRLYMSGTIRSWLHYLEVRCGPETQLEHRLVAGEIKKLLLIEVPSIMELV